jgi:hypothetical protein
MARVACLGQEGFHGRTAEPEEGHNQELLKRIQDLGNSLFTTLNTIRDQAEVVTESGRPIYEDLEHGLSTFGSVRIRLFSDNIGTVDGVAYGTFISVLTDLLKDVK